MEVGQGPNWGRSAKEEKGLFYGIIIQPSTQQFRNK
jgi:hypothetical protein